MSKRTIRCQMAPTPTMAASLQVTCETFAAACNAILALAVEQHVSNNVTLHHLVYAQIRADFGLSANLTVRAIRRVSAAMHAAKKRTRVPTQFRPTSIDYDARIFDYREADETVSLTTMRGRLHIPLLLGDYQRDALRGQQPTAATVVHHGRRWDIHMVVEDDDGPAREGPPMGVDVGIRNTATTSHGTFYEGQTRQAFQAERRKVRASLQSHGTPGAKRVLRRLSGYEARRTTHENHCLAKEIVTEAQRHGCGTIRMEQLTGIRDRTRIWNKHRNRMIGGWSFFQLQAFVEYKAARVGIGFARIDPKYTSTSCSRCGSLGIRQQDAFRCTACGYAGHADLNGALNIAAGGANVTWPESTPGTPPTAVESRLL